MTFQTELKRVRTKKKHLCWYCNGEIPAGSSVMSWSGIWDDNSGWHRSYMHDICLKVADYNNTVDERPMGGYNAAVKEFAEIL